MLLVWCHLLTNLITFKLTAVNINMLDSLDRQIAQVLIILSINCSISNHNAVKIDSSHYFHIHTCKAVTF